MDLNKYQRLAMQTANRDMEWEEQFTNAVLGLTGEAGEVADEWKKCRYHGHPYVMSRTMGELGDVLWYLALAADAMGTTLNDIAAHNIKKLSARYPEGFSPECSRNKGKRPGND